MHVEHDVLDLRGRAGSALPAALEPPGQWSAQWSAQFDSGAPNSTPMWKRRLPRPRFRSGVRIKEKTLAAAGGLTGRNEDYSLQTVLYSVVSTL